MTIAEDLWLRGQAAQRDLMHIASYNSAFLGNATLQAWQLTLTAPAVFWTAMARVGEAEIANARLSGSEPEPRSAKIVRLDPPKAKPAPKPVQQAKPVVQERPSTQTRPAPKSAPAATPKPAPAAKTTVKSQPKPVAKTAAAPKAKSAAKAQPAKAKKAKKAEINPVLLDEPRGGKADDLKVLNGIGAKLETTLNEFGIYHFDQLAGLNADGITWLNDQQKGFAMTCERFDIVGQAKAKIAK